MPTPDEARADLVGRIAAGDFDDVELVEVDDPHEAGQYNPVHGHNEPKEMEV